MQKWEPAGRIGDFGNVFNGLAKSPRVLRSSWILIEWVKFVLQNCEILHSVRGLYDKKSASWYCFTSDVMYKWYKRLFYTHPDLLARFCKVNLSNAKKFGLINQRWSRAIILINVIEDDCQFLGVHMRLSTRCKIWFTLCSLGLLEITFL